MASDVTRTERLGHVGSTASLHADELQPGAMCGEYIVEERLAAGGFGTVYVARHRVLERRAAVKVLHRERVLSPQFVKRFVQEARLVNLVRHPNIVDVYEFGQLLDGRPYLVMELLQGSSLAERLSAGKLPLDESVDIARQLTLALEAAHAKGIVHRDLKPANVFLAPRPDGGTTVKLLDFGIAKLSDDGLTAGDATQTGTGILASPPYASPEQAASRPAGAASDVYSLGVLLYRMALDRLPFEGPTTVDYLADHMHRPPPPPRAIWRQVPRPLDRLLLAMLAKSPADRPSVAEVRAALKSVRGARARRTRIGPAAAAAAVLVGSAVALIATQQRAAGPDRADAPTIEAAAPVEPSTPPPVASAAPDAGVAPVQEAPPKRTEIADSSAGDKPARRKSRRPQRPRPKQASPAPAPDPAPVPPPAAPAPARTAPTETTITTPATPARPKKPRPIDPDSPFEAK